MIAKSPYPTLALLCLAVLSLFPLLLSAAHGDHVSVRFVPLDTPVITLDTLSADTACYNDFVEFLVTANSTSPIQYQWQKDAQDLPGWTSAVEVRPVNYNSSGNYRCIATDATGADTSDAMPFFMAGEHDWVFADGWYCEGDTAWFNGDFYTSTTVLYDTVPNIYGFCDQIWEITFFFNTPPVVTLDPFAPDTFCSTESNIMVPDASPAYGGYSGPGISGSWFHPNQAGVGTHTIYYEVFSAGCWAIDSTQVTVVLCNGREELYGYKQLQVFPNPNAGQFRIQLTDFPSSEPIEAKLANLQGQTVGTSTFRSGNSIGNYELAFNGLPDGIYLLEVRSEASTYYRKIVIQQ